jgi:hypothetical protein
MLVLPQPFGPMIDVTPLENSISRRELKDLNPLISSLRKAKFASSGIAVPVLERGPRVYRNATVTKTVIFQFLPTPVSAFIRFERSIRILCRMPQATLHPH